MSGAAIVGALLRADVALLGLVPAARIKNERLPDDAPLPTVVVREISSSDRQTLKQRQFVRSVDRVSVTVRAANLRERDAVLKLVRAACAGKLGSIAECERVSVLTAGKGPGLAGPANSYERPQDFSVSYDAPL